MHDRLVVVVAFLVVAAIGLVVLFASRRRVIIDQDFVHEFGNHFAALTASDGKDNEVYAWLIKNSNRMQESMGHDGIYAIFSPPFSNDRYRNYPIILNMVPAVRKALLDPILSRHISEQYHSAIGEALLRHVGRLDQRAEEVATKLRNPLIWVREGIRWIVALPVAILSWVGFISAQRARALSYGMPVRIVTALVTLVGFVSAIIGIVLGWDEFIQRAGVLLQQVASLFN